MVLGGRQAVTQDSQSLLERQPTTAGKGPASQQILARAQRQVCADSFPETRARAGDACALQRDLGVGPGSDGGVLGVRTFSRCSRLLSLHDLAVSALLSFALVAHP